MMVDVDVDVMTAVVFDVYWPPNIQNVPAFPTTDLFKDMKNSAIKPAVIRLMNVATLTARPRIWSGKISETSTQPIGL